MLNIKKQNKGQQKTKIKQILENPTAELRLPEGRVDSVAWRAR